MAICKKTVRAPSLRYWTLNSTKGALNFGQRIFQNGDMCNLACILIFCIAICMKTVRALNLRYRALNSTK